MLTNVLTILQDAQKGGYAVGAFNVVNMETAHAVLAAAREMKSPVILQFTETTMDYIGGRALLHAMSDIAESYYGEVSVGIHLDHGRNLEVVERALEIGVPSVMYDGSRHTYADNVMNTKKVVKMCREKDIPVQAELGNVPYIGEISADGSVDWEQYMTDPEEARDFVSETGVDTLAVAVGNAHGFVAERPEPDYARLTKIRAAVSVPIVMHGASDWGEERVERVIEIGVSCFNVDTASRVAFVGALAHQLRDAENISYDMRKLLGAGRDAMKATVKEKMRLFMKHTV